MTDHIKVRTVLDGIVKVPKTNNTRTISDLKNGVYNLRGWEASTQHVYQNGIELKDDQTLSESSMAKGFVLLIPINHQQRRYKTKTEIESQTQQLSNTASNLLPTTPTSGSSSSVSDQLAQIMEEFASTHPGGNTATTTTTNTTATTASTRPATQPVQNTTTTTTSTRAATPTTTQPRPSQPNIGDYQRQLLIDNIPVDENLVAVVMELGFSKRIAKKALVLHNLDPEAAVEWIFSNTDNPYILESEFSAEELVQLAQRYQNAMQDE